MKIAFEQPGAAAPSLSQRLVRGGSWALLAKLLALPVGLLQVVLLTRVLEPADVGAYFLAVSLVGLLAILAQAGMSRPTVKLVASALATGRPEAARHAVRVAFAVTLALGGLLALALAGGPGRCVTPMLEDGARVDPLLPIMAVMVIAVALLDLGVESLRGFQNLRAVAVFGDSLAQRFLLTLVLAMIWIAAWPASLGLVLATTLGIALLVLSLALGLLRRHLAAIGHHGERWSVADILAHGLPFLLVRLNVWFLAGADLWVLGMFKPPEEVALYGAASRVAMLVGMPLAACNAVLAPVIAELFSRDERARLERVIRAAATLGALPSLALALTFLLLGDRILAALFTDAYAAGRPILAALAIGQFIHVLFGSCGLALTMTGHQRDVVAVSALAGLATVVGFYLVAPAFGGVGIAVVVAVSLAVYNLVLAGLVRRRLKMISWGTFSPNTFHRFSAELRQLGRGD